jgi:hypothetical protein
LDAYPEVFVIRSLAVDELNSHISECREFPEHYPSLRLNQEKIENLHYFQTSSIDEAKAIQQITSNRRFPVTEELLCSFSDPCFSYWMEKTSRGFSISTKMLSRDMNQMIRLGDFGDFNIFRNKMIELVPLIQSMPGQWKIYSQDHRINFEGPMDNYFWSLLNILFKEGDCSDDFTESLSYLACKKEMVESEWLKLLQYLNQIGFLRRFWKNVFSQLKDLGSSKATLAI